MESFVERGEDYNDCMSRIMAKYGERVVPLRHRKVRVGGIFNLFTREGVEVEFYIPSYFSKTSSVSSVQPSSAPLWTGKEVRLPQEARLPQAAIDFEKEKEKVIAAAGKDMTLQMVLKEIRDINEKINAPKPASVEGEEHESFRRLREILEHNDFSSSYSEKLIGRARRECPLETLDNFEEFEEKILGWIGEGISIYHEPPRENRRSPRIMILLGPTGVGKTTTIAKLAAAYGVDGWGKKPLRVRIITIDGYRIAAREQIEKYGDIMGIPVSYATNAEDMRKAIALYSKDVDLVLVDTIGKSPRDAIKLGEMKEFLHPCLNSAETHLALAATTKYSDIKDIMQQFAPFNYRSVIVTKLDETIRTGNVISALADQGKAVSYITDGQPVHQHLHPASVIRFLVNLEGFRVNRDKIEELFSGGEARPASPAEDTADSPEK